MNQSLEQKLFNQFKRHSLKLIKDFVPLCSPIPQPGEDFSENRMEGFAAAIADRTLRILKKNKLIK